MSKPASRPMRTAATNWSRTTSMSARVIGRGTWLIGGFAVYFMLRSVGAEVGLATIPYLGGVSAVGAIVGVLAFFTPSGLGAREASMYGLLLAVTTAGPALSVTLLNRLAITLVELLLFFAGLVGWRVTRSRRA